MSAKPTIRYRVADPVGGVHEFDSVREINSVALVLSPLRPGDEPTWSVVKTSKAAIGKNIGQSPRQSAYFRENYPWVVVVPEIV